LNTDWFRWLCKWWCLCC